MSWPYQDGFLPLRHLLLYGLLPSPLKVLLYRLRGYRIGKGVSIGLGSVVVGEEVHIGDHTTLGFADVIRGRKIDIGSHVSIGSASFVRATDIEIGDGAVLTEQVFIGGQEETEESKIKLGKNTVVMYMSFINTSRPVTIGDDSGVGGYCIIFPHGAWLSKYEGYPIKHEAVEIGKSVWLPWRVFVMPGAKIGDGSVIGANSLVIGEIPPHCIAMGSPAKVVKTDVPTPPTREQNVATFEDMVDRLVRHFRFHRYDVAMEGNVIRVSKVQRHLGIWKRVVTRTLVVAKDEDALADFEKSHLERPVDLLLSLPEVGSGLRRALNRKEIMWLDVARKERSERSHEPFGAEVGHFVGRWGVRFTYMPNRAC